MKPQDTKCPYCEELQGFFRWCDGPTAVDMRCAHGQYQAHGFILCKNCGTVWGPYTPQKVSIALVAVDPGIVTGVAVWSDQHDVNPVATATFRAPKKKDWFWSANSVTDQLEKWLRQYQFQSYCLGFIEEPAFFDTSGGHMVARRGDFCKLAMIAGWEIAVLIQLGIVPRLVGIQNWKGQLPKTIVRDRIREVLDKPVTGSEHEWDAIGIGLAARGMLDL